MKIIAGIAAAVLLAAILVSGSFLVLNNACSLGNSPMVGQQVRHSGSDEKSRGAEPSEHSSSPQEEKAKPSARFELRKTDTNKVEGSYYAENTDREKETWSHKFFCDTKIGEFTLAVFTLFLVLFTGGLWWSTSKLWQATNTSVALAQKELFSTHRPLIRVRQIIRKIDKDAGKTFVTFGIVNKGASQCFNVGGSINLKFVYPGDRYDPNSLPLSTIPFRSILPVGGTDRITIGIDEVDEKGVGGRRLRLFGFFVYSDEAGDTRTTFFCRDHYAARKRFEAVDDPDLDSED